MIINTIANAFYPCLSANEMRNNQFSVGCSSLFFRDLRFQQFVFQYIFAL